MKLECGQFLTSALTLFAPGDALYNLAHAYTALGRHQDALVMQEKTLEFRWRVLPENHPQIGAMQMVQIHRRHLMLSFAGETMSNLASAYKALGRHQDALKMQEKTLEFRRRVLPENHPQIGAT